MTIRRSKTALARRGTHHGDDLVERAATGDHQAFIAIVRRHDDRLRGLAYRLLAGDASAVDDALQEAYAHAYRALPQFRGGADVGTWLYRITYNACVDELRRRRRRPQPVDTSDAAWEQPATEHDPAMVASAADTTIRALATLPHDQRAAVVLVDGEGFDYASAAELLGVAPGTVASRVSRARAAVRRAIGEDHR